MNTNKKNTFVIKAAIPFILIHLAVFAVFWSGITQIALIMFFILFFSRIFIVTGVYHRYFSHKSYETSRWFQFVLAFLAETSAQEGVIWWANHHRRHHQYSDTPQDVHSPRRQGFWYAHVGWIFTPEYISHDYDMVKDWEKFPELVWINKYHYLPSIVLGVIAWLIGGWSGLVVGFVWSTIALYHATFAINSLTHVYGKQRFITGDDSRNNLWLALLTFGEGWHNNHHYYATCARQGFYWWEIDITYYLLRALGAIGLIWNIKEPPAEVLNGTASIPKKMIERTRELIREADCTLGPAVFGLQEIRDEILLLENNPDSYLNTRYEEFSQKLKKILLWLYSKEKLAHQLPVLVAAIIIENAKKSSAAVEKAIASLTNAANPIIVIEALNSAIVLLQAKLEPILEEPL